MNYFKQTAALIVLIFILFVAFRIFEEQNEERRLTELRVQKAEEKRQYDECVSAVDAVKRFDENLAQSTLAESRTNGSFDQMMLYCLSTTHTPQPSRYDLDEDNFYANMQKLSEQKCLTETAMKILTYPLSLDPETINSKHATGVIECKAKYNIK